jgi:tetratricopeptide (TPR) repeat protein
MPGDPRVQELLEELLESGHKPEEVCRRSPELLSEVLKRWHRLHACEAELDAWFPPPGNAARVDNPLAVEQGGELPRIPGYEVQELLGRGGMGVVFRARHLSLNRIVALKMALAGAYAGPRERERFQREAEAVAGLRHPNVVQIHDVGDSDGRPYYTMEFVEGGSLAQKLAGTPRPASQAAALVASLAAAVESAHQGGIVHRDLKPANVLLTTDGTPKISDFGLARRFAGEPDLTWSGTVVGTPSYMPPEQARGKSLAVGPAVDIYALGAILYELLTGRPPFRGATPEETVQQVIAQDPVPPSRLNGKVPRDLETICLKCLQKDPERRYATAAALADDLHRFERGEPIAARPVGRPERVMTWIRRNPTAAALLFTVLALMGLAVVAGMREWAVAAERRQEMAKWSDRLAFAIDLQQQGRFAEARAILEKANTGDAVLRQKIEYARGQLDLVEKIDEVRLNRGNFVQGSGIDYSQSSRCYEAIFREAGLGELNEHPERVAERLNGSPIRKALIAALDDWAACAEKKERDWILRVARRMDPDPWRDRIRDPDGWAKMEAFPDLAATVNVQEQPVTLMVAFGTRWRRLGGDPTAFLERVQRRYPNDFWVNFELSHLVGGHDWAKSMGYCRAALAARPDAAVVHYKLGVCSGNLGRIDDAIQDFQRALDFAPDHAWALVCLAGTLADKGRLNEAIDYLHKVPATDTQLPGVRRAIIEKLIDAGRHEVAWLEWRQLIEGGANPHDDWDGYAELGLFLGHEDEYLRACQEMLKQFNSASDPHLFERIGRACLLLPASEEQSRKAAEFTDRALAADKSKYEGWAYPYFLFAKGLAEYRQNRLERAIAILKGEASGVLGPAPKLVLAMAQYRRGERKEALHILALAVVDFDWRMGNATSRETWFYHVLRREAERLILPDLRAFLDGKYVPRDPDERLALLGVCQATNRTGAAARLYADAFAQAPRLAEDLGAGHRYSAARVAALAGCGRGEDAAGLGEPERTQWRGQARQWLRADLAAWGKARGGDPGAARDLVRRTLMPWRANPDLAGLREPAELDRLSAGERADCLALWHEVREMLERNGGK